MSVFVCRDSGLTALLDDLAETLRTRGHDVARGPADLAGRVKHYSEAERAALFATVQVAVFTVRHDCPRQLMVEAPQLRGVCYPTIGIESLDLGAANDLGVIVGHGAVRGNIIGMAESTVMLMLMLLYDVQANVELLRRGQWRRQGHHGRQMAGKTVGLIGFGRIAREVAQLLSSFGVRLLTYSPRAREDSLPSTVTKVGLERLLSESDVVTVLTGLTPETLHMLDARMLALMRPGAFLVNTGRGAIIDESALVEVLRERRIAGAALDTFAVEPLPPESPLRDLPNVILTPHCVGHTHEGWKEFGPALIENIERILRGELPLYCKNPEVEPHWRDRLARLAAHAGAEALGT